MAQELWITGSIIGGIVGYTTAGVVQHPETAGSLPAPAWVVGLVFAFIAGVLWLYSPLPNRTVFGGPGGQMGSTEAGYWGFSRPTNED